MLEKQQKKGQGKVDVLDRKMKQYSVVLFNDDVHTFDFVIEVLVSICKHEPLQAEQCAMLVHYKGKCAVKIGEYAKLLPIANSLLEKGLTVEIQ